MDLISSNSLPEYRKLCCKTNKDSRGVFFQAAVSRKHKALHQFSPRGVEAASVCNFCSLNKLRRAGGKMLRAKRGGAQCGMCWVGL